MFSLRIEHQIHGFDMWKAAFDRLPTIRERAGVRSHRVFRPVDDPNYVMIDLDFDSADAAEAFLVSSGGQYWFRLEDTEGIVGDDAPHEIRAVADLPPTVRFEEPAKDEQYTPAAVVPLRIAAKDDLALHGATLQIFIASPGADAKPAHEIVLATADAPPPQPMGLGTDKLIPCKNQALFVQHALPHLIERCVECHDGTKLKGSIKFFLGRDADSTLPDDQAFACSVTLSSGVTLENRLQSKIFTESDPSRPDVEHEFKFPDPASFAVYRDAVMIWLQTE